MRHMKIVFAVLGMLIIGSTAVRAADPPAPACTTTVQDKKLSGAAKTSFMTRCKNDTIARCDEMATNRKLFGAARNSFTNKCVNDGVGS
jgi:hypothetical protein